MSAANPMSSENDPSNKVTPTISPGMTSEPDSAGQGGSMNAPKAPIQSPSTRRLSFAVRYARMGLRVLPCMPGTKEPACKLKTEATCDLDQILKWFGRGTDYNLAVVVPDGFVVLEIDSAEGERALAFMDRGLPETAIQRTPRGSHRWYSIPKGVKLRQTIGEIAPGVDTRPGGTRYVLVEPSVINDKPYRWEIPLTMGTKAVIPDAVAPVPQWMIDLIRDDQPHGRNGTATPKVHAPRWMSPAYWRGSPRGDETPSFSAWRPSCTTQMYRGK